MTVKLTWLSHACVLIETDNVKILVDPFLTGNPLASAKAEEIEADYIFVSHGHADHIGDTVEIAKKNNAVVVANPEISTWLQAQGIEKIQHLQIGGAYEFAWGKAKMTYATHSSSLPDGSYGGNPSGFIFYIDGKKIYHACDTGLFNDMKLIGAEEIDVALLPIGDAYTMGIDDSIKATNFIEAKKVIPIHYNTFDLIKQCPESWKEKIKKYTDCEPLVMKPGETITI